jgi:hypothetical protein
MAGSCPAQVGRATAAAVAAAVVPPACMLPETAADSISRTCYTLQVAQRNSMPPRRELAAVVQVSKLRPLFLQQYNGSLLLAPHAARSWFYIRHLPVLLCCNRQQFVQAVNAVNLLPVLTRLCPCLDVLNASHSQLFTATSHVSSKLLAGHALPCLTLSQQALTACISLQFRQQASSSSA